MSTTESSTCVDLRTDKYGRQIAVRVDEVGRDLATFDAGRRAAWVVDDLTDSGYGIIRPRPGMATCPRSLAGLPCKGEWCWCWCSLHVNAWHAVRYHGTGRREQHMINWQPEGADIFDLLAVLKGADEDNLYVSLRASQDGGLCLWFDGFGAACLGAEEPRAIEGGQQ